MNSRLVTVAAAASALTMTPAYATTCSCASVPLLGTMELASPADNQWYLASTYEFHDLSELVQGSSTIPDDTARDRTSHALILEASRGLTEKWAVSALLSTLKLTSTLDQLACRSSLTATDVSMSPCRYSSSQSPFSKACPVLSSDAATSAPVICASSVTRSTASGCSA